MLVYDRKENTMFTNTSQQIRNPLFAVCTTPSSLIIPSTGFLRISQIIGDPKSDPPKHPLIPISRAAWWAGVKSGRYPKSIKLSPRVTVWRAEDIAALISRLGGGDSDNVGCNHG